MQLELDKCGKSNVRNNRKLFRCNMNLTASIMEKYNIYKFGMKQVIDQNIKK